jgi:hypothetical protein
MVGIATFELQSVRGWEISDGIQASNSFHTLDFLLAQPIMVRYRGT